MADDGPRVLRDRVALVSEVLETPAQRGQTSNGVWRAQPRAPQQLIQPPHPAARPQGPAFAPRQGSAPPRFAGPPPQPATFANGSGDRVRSTSASSGPPGQPARKGSNTTDAGARKSRSRSAVDEPKLVGNSYRANPPEDNSYRAIPRNSSKNSSQEIPPEDSISGKGYFWDVKDPMAVLWSQMTEHSWRLTGILCPLIQSGYFWFQRFKTHCIIFSVRDNKNIEVVQEVQNSKDFLCRWPEGDQQR